MSDFSVGSSKYRHPAKVGEIKSRKTNMEMSQEAQPRELPGRFDVVKISDNAQANRIPAVLAQRAGAGGGSGAPDSLEDLLRSAGGAAYAGFSDMGGPLWESVTPPERPEAADALQEAEYEASVSWTEHLRKWLREGVGQQELNRRSEAWAGALMREHPPQFRAWLERDRELIESGHLSACVLPAGFSEADYREWMSKDVQEYM